MIADKAHLVKLADEIEAYGFECEGGPLKNCKPWQELKRRLASSDGEVKGEPEPVAWHDGVPPKPWADEWFIAETIYHERVVLRSLPEEYTYDFKTADETYIKAANIKRWMQFPDSEYIAKPADAGMREALENVRGFLDTPVWRRRFAEAPFYCDVIASIRNALTSPGATTKSDGTASAEGRVLGPDPCVGKARDIQKNTAVVAHGPSDLDARFKRLEKEAADLGYVLTPEPEHPDSPHRRPSDPSSTRSESPEYVIRKSGYFYRPKAQGYTSCICEAGRWTKEEADKYADDVEGVTVHLASEFPSSTRSDVTVDELVEWCKRNQFFPSWDKARALLDQFEIRRK